MSGAARAHELDFRAIHPPWLRNRGALELRVDWGID